ncbi:flagellar biosynthetic protein FliO [Buchnera aphidicola]|nr:flagellar biosynthetic protein FliO [Buchnera aphidicola]
MYSFLFIFFILFLIKRCNLFYWNKNNVSYITDKVYLNPDHYICILHIEKTRLLLAVTLTKINVIHELPSNLKTVIKNKNKCSFYSKPLKLLKSIIFWFK